MEQLENALTALHHALIDSRNGYEEAVNKAEQPQMIDVFQGMIELRLAHIAQIQKALVERGAPIDATGTLMSTVHRTVIDIRSMLTGLNPASLESFAGGEDAILKKYDDAVAKAGGDRALLQLLGQQREDLVAKVEFMRQTAKAA